MRRHSYILQLAQGSFYNTVGGQGFVYVRAMTGCSLSLLHFLDDALFRTLNKASRSTLHLSLMDKPVFKVYPHEILCQHLPNMDTDHIHAQWYNVTGCSCPLTSAIILHVV